MKLASFLFSVLLITSSASVGATTHTITFPGFSYSPSTLQVAVGDTITWEGDFTFHPLKSDVIPNAAPEFAKEGGGVGVFTYVVMLPGSYSYYCTRHGAPGGIGMSGSFTAVASGVTRTSELSGATLYQSYPNPAKHLTNITFELAKAAEIDLKVFTLEGKEVTGLAQGVRSAGKYTIPFDAAQLDAGIYFYRLVIGGEAITGQMIVTK